MAPRLLILSAGTGTSNNLIRSLKAGDPNLFIVGCHDDRFILKKSSADRNYLIPALTHWDFAAALGRVIETEKIDLLIPTSDAHVRVVSRIRGKIPCHLFLPRKSVIQLCQDKYNLTAFLRSRGLPVPLTYPVTDARKTRTLFRRLPRRSLVWCRIRTGTGSLGAIPVNSPEQAESWIRCWQEIRGVRARSFTLSEYLPGRDFGCQSLWKEGKLILVKTYERLSYLGTGNQLSWASSIAALAKTVFEPRVVELSTKAIRALDKKPSGAFSIDLTENASGVPCITEINAGRFTSAMNICDLTGKHNMALMYVYLGLDEPVDIYEEYDVAEDYYMLRDLDTPPAIFHAEEFFDGIEEV